MNKRHEVAKQGRGQPQKPEQVGSVLEEAHVEVFFSPRATVVEMLHDAFFGQSQFGNVIISVEQRLPRQRP